MTEVPARRPGIQYAFRDTDAAADRLAAVNRVFEPSYRALLDAAALPERIESAVDLGCGPGFTTRLLTEVLEPESVAGIDVSESFVARARSETESPVNWYVHDVTSVPFPSGPADLIHARWVLAHLREPLAALADWLTQLRPGGVLLIQEDEHISSDHPVLARYQAISDALVAHHGGDLYVGRRLAQAPLPPRYERTLNRVYDHRVPAPVAARIFAMNFEVWRHDPWICQQHQPDALDELARELDGTARSDDAAAIVFSIRQLAIARAE